MHVTNDIARGMSTSIAHAERMKTLWGSALAASIDEREMLSVPLLGERGVDTVQQGAARHAHGDSSGGASMRFSNSWPMP